MTDRERTNSTTCPACGEGQLESRAELAPVEYHGSSRELPLSFSVCTHCGSEIAGKEESRQNKRVMNAFKKEVDGLIGGQEIREFRKRLRINQALLASLLGGGEIAFSRYENDDVVQSAAMNTALMLCISSPANLLILAGQKGIELPADTVGCIRTDQRHEFVSVSSR